MTRQNRGNGYVLLFKTNSIRGKPKRRPSQALFKHLISSLSEILSYSIHGKLICGLKVLVTNRNQTVIQTVCIKGGKIQ